MKNIALKISEDRCIQCGVCVSECPHHQVKKGSNHVDHSYEYCDRCQHCYAVCPEHAIGINGHEITNERPAIPADALLGHFMHRRSYRRFRNEAISKEDLDILRKAASYIPSGGNDHQFSLTVMTSSRQRKELVQEIHLYYLRLMKLLTNPVIKPLLRLFGDHKVKSTLNDPTKFRKILHAIQQINGIDDVIFYDAPAVFFFHTARIMPTAMEDCILSAYNVVLQSETLGLGSCFVSLSQQAVTQLKKCKQILCIPNSHKVHAVVIVGHPVKRYMRPAFRPLKQVYYA